MTGSGSLMHSSSKNVCTALVTTISALCINSLTLPPNAVSAAKNADPGEKERCYAEAKKHFNKGVELQQSGFYNQAISEYRTALQFDDKMEEALGNAGIIYAEQKSYKHAIDSFQAALRIKPKSPTVLNALGSVLFSRGKTEEAMEQWKRHWRQIQNSGPHISTWEPPLKQNTNLPTLWTSTRKS
jgi:Tfp pilus assembly protein PilF